MPTDRCLHCHAPLQASAIAQGMPFCSREHRELYRLLHDREPEPAPVKVRSINSLSGHDPSPLSPRGSTRGNDPAQPFADGNCQFCGKVLPIFARLRGSRFCGSDHEASFHQRQTQETLERLAAGQRKQVNPGSVRIRQRAKPSSQPPIFHQPPSARDAQIWKMVDLTRNTTAPTIDVPLQTPPIAPPPSPTDCLPTAPGIWPPLPDHYAPPHWWQPTLATALPSPDAPQFIHFGFHQGTQLDIQPPTPARHPAVAVTEPSYLTPFRPAGQLPSTATNYPFHVLTPAGSIAFHHWTVAPATALPVPPSQLSWRNSAAQPLLPGTPKQESPCPANPTKSTISPLSTPASLPALAYRTPPPISWQINESAPFSPLAPASLTLLTAKPATTQPASRALPPIIPAQPVPTTNSSWATIALSVPTTATTPFVHLASRPGRATARPLNQALLPTEPRRRTRPPLQRLRMPAIGSGFATVIG